jgi:hypothetical protein
MNGVRLGCFFPYRTGVMVTSLIGGEGRGGEGERKGDFVLVGSSVCVKSRVQVAPQKRVYLYLSECLFEF